MFSTLFVCFFLFFFCCTERIIQNVKYFAHGERSVSFAYFASFLPTMLFSLLSIFCIFFFIFFPMTLFQKNKFRPWCVTVWSMLDGVCCSLIAYWFLPGGNIALTEVFKKINCINSYALFVSSVFFFLHSFKNTEQNPLKYNHECKYQ